MDGGITDHESQEYIKQLQRERDELRKQLAVATEAYRREYVEGKAYAENLKAEFRKERDELRQLVEEMSVKMGKLATSENELRQKVEAMVPKAAIEIIIAKSERFNTVASAECYYDLKERLRSLL